MSYIAVSCRPGPRWPALRSLCHAIVASLDASEGKERAALEVLSSEEFKPWSYYKPCYDTPNFSGQGYFSALESSAVLLTTPCAPRDSTQSIVPRNSWIVSRLTCMLRYCYYEGKDQNTTTSTVRDAGDLVRFSLNCVGLVRHTYKAVTLGTHMEYHPTVKGRREREQMKKYLRRVFADLNQALGLQLLREDKLHRV
jgi:hypothetical protein